MDSFAKSSPTAKRQYPERLQDLQVASTESEAKGVAVTELMLIANRLVLMRSHRARSRFLSHLAYRVRANFIAKRNERTEFVSVTEHVVTRDPMHPHFLNR
jgi:hypothetical protein